VPPEPPVSIPVEPPDAGKAPLPPFDVSPPDAPPPLSLVPQLSIKNPVPSSQLERTPRRQTVM
jgi:hypothetical protein